MHTYFDDNGTLDLVMGTGRMLNRSISANDGPVNAPAPVPKKLTPAQQAVADKAKKVAAAKVQKAAIDLAANQKMQAARGAAKLKAMDRQDSQQAAADTKAQQGVTNLKTATADGAVSGKDLAKVTDHDRPVQHQERRSTAPQCPEECRQRARDQPDHE